MEHGRHKTSAGLRAWRSKQPRGAIMKPGTFNKIKKGAAARGARNPEKVAGAAYWRTAKAKFADRKKNPFRALRDKS